MEEIFGSYHRLVKLDTFRFEHPRHNRRQRRDPVTGPADRRAWQPLPAKSLALAGGVGGAKLVLGLTRLLSPEQLTIVVNTGDDETFHGLHVSPDLDTMLYTLAGISNPDTGWGLAGESFRALEMLTRYGAETWFNLGDRDLATHIRRTQLLGQGTTLSEVTAELCQSLGVAHPHRAHDRRAGAHLPGHRRGYPAHAGTISSVAAANRRLNRSPTGERWTPAHRRGLPRRWKKLHWW